MRGYELKNSLAVERSERVVDHENCVRHMFIHCRERLVEFLGLAHRQRLDDDTHRLSASLRRAITQCHARIGCIPQHRHAAQRGSHFVEKSQPLGRNFRRHVRDARDVAAGRARPSTNPVPTGSPVVNDTTGRVVPSLAASAEGYPKATMTSTLLVTNSSTRRGSWSTCISAPRCSNVKFLSSV